MATDADAHCGLDDKLVLYSHSKAQQNSLNVWIQRLAKEWKKTLPFLSFNLAMDYFEKYNQVALFLDADLVPYDDIVLVFGFQETSALFPQHGVEGGKRGAHASTGDAR